MPKRILRAIGGLKPWKPKRSLPSYKEPTPETSPRLSREAEAELALTRTTFTAGSRLFLIALFLVTIASVPLIQLLADLRSGAQLPMPVVLKALPSVTEIAAVRSLRELWNLLPEGAELKAAEKTLETDSVLSQWLLPPVQGLLVGELRAANEQVYLGRDGWLFYRPDIEYITGPPFLGKAHLKQQGHKAHFQPEPIKAIVHFRNQLAARGIDLIVVAVPVKPTIEGGRLSSKAGANEPLQNASFAEFQRRLLAAGVRLFDPAPLMAQRKPEPQYLATDTHWRPETMELVARALARWSGGISVAQDAGETDRVSSSEQFSPKDVTGIGDTARMLKLPRDQHIHPPERVTIRQVTSGTGWWRPTREADVLLLGDSFTNIFSQEGLGWGEAAGFAEHLSVALGGRPLDCILRNSDGAFATREMLSNELARGRDRLAGKKLVIWEFAARELAFGNWKLLDLKLGTPAPVHFFTLGKGEEIEVTGTIEAVSAIPRPGSVPYKDHVMAVHLTDFTRAGETESRQAVVYLSSMQDNTWTPAARLRAGDRITVRLRGWSDVSAQYEQLNRSDIDDRELQLEEPVWGELVK